MTIMRHLDSVHAPHRNSLRRRGGWDRASELACTLALAVVAAAGCVMPLDKALSNTAEKNSTTAAARTDRPAAAATGTLRVGNEVLTPTDIWAGEHDRLNQAANQGQATLRQYAERRSVKLITDRVTEALLYQHAIARLPENAIKALDKIVDGELRRIITTEHDGVQRRLERTLVDEGRTLDDLRRSIRREVVITRFLEQAVKPKIAEPTRAELVAAFQATADEFAEPARRQMSLILIRVEDFREGTDGQSMPESTRSARAKAGSLARTMEAELRNGTDFAEMARRHSSGLHAVDGGSWGWVTRDSVRKRFKPAVDALFQLQEGEVSHVIETPEEYFIVRCDAIDPAVSPSFESMQPRLKRRYTQERYNHLIAELVAELRRDSNIEEKSLQDFHNQCVAVAMKRE